MTPEQRDDDQVSDADSTGPSADPTAPVCADDTELERGMNEIGSTLAGLSQKFRAFNNRAYHMSRDLSGMSLELSDVTDDIADIRDTTKTLNVRSLETGVEVEKLRAEIARLANAVEKLTGS